MAAFIRKPSSTLSAEHQLLCAILARALADARRKSYGGADKQAALRWLRDGQDVRYLLELLDLDADVICAQLQRAAGLEVLP